jgi:hypothetical protein
MKDYATWILELKLYCFSLILIGKAWCLVYFTTLIFCLASFTCFIVILSHFIYSQVDVNAFESLVQHVVSLLLSMTLKKTNKGTILCTTVYSAKKNSSVTIITKQMICNRLETVFEKRLATLFTPKYK